MFRDREHAGRRLAGRLRDRALHGPLVLAVPCGGVAVGAALAHALGAELDVVLARKLPDPSRPETALGAFGEDGDIYLTPYGEKVAGLLGDYLHDAARYQMVEIARQRQLFRTVRPAARALGRSVIVADDGLATGATMLAALRVVRAENPRELIVAVPVASPQAREAVAASADEVVCLLHPEGFGSVGRFYQNFRPVQEDQVVALLRASAPARPPGPGNAAG
jgi:predicted phosphoribosyltransferase